jgi:pimeloyl-ACP methyl ester carboxylesterase
MIPPVEMRFQSGNLTLSGALYQPETEQSFPLAVMVHPASIPLCLDPYYDHLRSGLPEQGIGFLVFDRRGSGDSLGDFESASFEDLADDVVAAVQAARDKYGDRISKVTLLGTSQGAWIEPLAARKSNQIDSLILVSACGVTPAEQMTYSAITVLARGGFGKDIQNKVVDVRARIDDYFRNPHVYPELLKELKAIQAEPWFELAYLPGDGDLPDDPHQSKWFLEMDYLPLPVWKDVYIPSLFLYAEDDIWVPVDVSMANYQEVTTHLPHVEFQVIPNTDHLMYELDPPTSAISPDYMKEVMNWIRNRLSD